MQRLTGNLKHPPLHAAETETSSHDSDVSERLTIALSHLVVTFVLRVVGVPYSDDYVSGAKVKIGVICNVVDADVFLDPDDLEGEAGELMTRPRWATAACVTPGVSFPTDLHVVNRGIEFDPLDDARSALMIPRLDHTVHPRVLQGLC